MTRIDDQIGEGRCKTFSLPTKARPVNVVNGYSFVLNFRCMDHQKPNESISSEQLNSPSVYAWRRGNEYLYIGMSRQGLRRPVTNGHAVIGKRDEFLPSDAIDIWRFAESDDAARFEQDMIREHEPLFNRLLYKGGTSKYQKKPTREAKCETCNKVFTTPRQRQKFCSSICRWKAWDKAHPRLKQTQKETQ